jgi:hypothetical protein
MRPVRHIDTRFWISHKFSKLNSKFVYYISSNSEYPPKFTCFCNLFAFVVATQQIMPEGVFVKRVLKLYV